MHLLKRKSKIVTFRVSLEEYDDLAKSSLESGAKSISAFARAAVLERCQSAGYRPIGISGDLATLGKALSELDANLHEASSKIRRLLGDQEAAARSGEHH